MSVCNICDQLVTQVKPIGNELQSILEKLDSQLKDSSADHADTEPPQWICDNCDLSVRNRYLKKNQEESSKQMLQMQLENEKLKNMINQLQQKSITNSISAVGKEINDSVAIKNVAMAIAEKSTVQLDNVASSMETVLPSDFANSSSRHDLTDNMLVEQATSCNTNSQLQIVTNDKSLQQSSTSSTTIICQSKYVITNDAAAADDILNKTAATDCALNVCPTHELNAKNTNEASFCSSSFSSNHSNALECLTDFALDQSNDEEFILDDNAQQYKSTENIFDSMEHKNKLTSYRNVKDYYQKDDNNEYVCKLCPENPAKYASPYNCARHIRRCHIGFQFVCNLCDKRFYYTDHIRNHYRSEHYMEPPSRIKTITTTDSTAKDYNRMLCEGSLSFSLDSETSEKLKQFYIIDNDLYVCKMCSGDASYTCKTRNSIDQHLSIDHLKLIFDCKHCNMKYKSKNGLRSHIKRRHNTLLQKQLMNADGCSNDDTTVTQTNSAEMCEEQTVADLQNDCNLITEKVLPAEEQKLNKYILPDDSTMQLQIDQDSAQNIAAFKTELALPNQTKPLNVLENKNSIVTVPETNNTELNFVAENAFNELTSQNLDSNECIQMLDNADAEDEDILSDESEILELQSPLNKKKSSSDGHIKSLEYNKLYREVNKTYYCMLCKTSKKYANRSLVRYHIRTHHLEVKYKCIECTAIYATYNAIRQHYESQHKNKQIPLPKEIAMIVLPSSLKADGQTTDNINLFQPLMQKSGYLYACNKCSEIGKSYISKCRDVTQHIKTCHQEAYLEQQQKTKLLQAGQSKRNNIREFWRKSDKLYVCILCEQSEKSFTCTYYEGIRRHIKAHHQEAYLKQQLQEKELLEAKIVLFSSNSSISINQEQQQQTETELIANEYFAASTDIVDDIIKEENQLTDYRFDEQRYSVPAEFSSISASKQKQSCSTLLEQNTENANELSSKQANHFNAEPSVILQSLLKQKTCSNPIEAMNIATKQEQHTETELIAKEIAADTDIVDDIIKEENQLKDYSFEFPSMSVSKQMQSCSTLLKQNTENADELSNKQAKHLNAEPSVILQNLFKQKICSNRIKAMKYNKFYKRNANRYYCLLCKTSRKYAYSSSIAQHIKSKHLGVKYKCMECNKMYRTYICLRQHYKKQHKTKQIPLAKEVIVMVLSTSSSSKTRQTIIRKTIDFRKLMQKSGNMYVCNTCANDGISYASRYSESVKRHIKACHLKSQKKNKQNTAYDSVNSNSNSNSNSMAIKQEQQHAAAALIAEDIITTTDIVNDIVKEENKLTEYRFDVLQNNVPTEIATGLKEFELFPQTVLGKQIAQKFFESKGCSMITEYTAAADKNVKETITDIPITSYKALNCTSIVGKTLENDQLTADNISDDNLEHDSETDTNIQQLDFDNQNTCNELNLLASISNKEETNENKHVDEMEQLLSLSQQKSSNKTKKSSNNHHSKSNRNMANNYYCVLCEPSEVYAHRCSILLHLKRRHIKIKYKCIECSEMTTTYQDIREHYQSQHQNKQIPSLKETRIMMLPTNSEAEQTAANISTDNYANFINYRKFYYRKMANNYYCMVCKPSKKYTNRSSLICHIKQCHIQVKYKCNECSEIYHDIPEHYQSQHKTKAIPSPEEIRMMMLPSSSEDGKNYCRPKNFKKLIRKSGDLYACIICAENGKSYRKKYFTLVKCHIKSLHYEAYEAQQQKKMPLEEYKDFDEGKQQSYTNQTKPIKYEEFYREVANNYHCVLCKPSTTYTCRSSLILHIKKSHIEVKYKCTECSKMYTAYSDIRQHYKSQHKTELIPSLEKIRMMTVSSSSSSSSKTSNKIYNFKTLMRQSDNLYVCITCEEDGIKYSSKYHESVRRHIKACHYEACLKSMLQEKQNATSVPVSSNSNQEQTVADQFANDNTNVKDTTSDISSFSNCTINVENYHHTAANISDDNLKNDSESVDFAMTVPGTSTKLDFDNLNTCNELIALPSISNKEQLEEYKDFDEVEQQSHTNQIKPIKCEDFYRKVANNYHCVLCEPTKTYTNRSSMILHIKKSHIEVKYKCTECSEMYTAYSDIRQHYKSQHKTELIPSLEEIRMMTVSSSSSSSKTRRKIYNFKTLIRQSGDLYVCITCENDGITYSSKYYESLRRHIKACHYEACLKLKLQEKQNATSGAVSSNSSNQKQTAADQFIAEDIIAATDNVNDIIKEENKLTEYRFDEQHNNMLSETTNGLKGFEFSSQSVLGKQFEQKVFSEESCSMAKENTAANDSNVKDATSDIPPSSNNTLENCQHTVANISDDNDENDSESVDFAMTEQLKEYKDFDEVQQSNKLELLSLSQQNSLKKIQQSHTNQIKPIKYEEFYREVANNYHCVLCEPSSTYTYRSTIISHLRKAHIKVKYKCTECSEIYTAFPDIRQHYKSQHKTETMPSIEKIRMMTVSSSSSQIRHKIYNFKTLLRQSGDLYVCITCEENGITYSRKHYESVRRHIKASHYEACLKPKLQKKQNATSEPVSSNSNQEQTAADQFIAEDIIAATDIVNDIIKEENKLTEYRFDEQHKGFEFSSQSVLDKQIEQKVFNEESFSMAKENTAANDNNVKDSTSDIPSSSNKTLENCQHIVANISDDNDEIYSELDCDKQNTCNELNLLASHSNNESNKLDLLNLSQQKSLNKTQQSSFNHFKPIKFSELYRKLGNYYNCMLCEPSKKYNYRSSVILHLKRWHIEVKYKCTKCSEMYATYCDIRQHYQSQHKIKRIPRLKKVRMMVIPSNSKAKQKSLHKTQHSVGNLIKPIKYEEFYKEIANNYYCVLCEPSETYAHRCSVILHLRKSHIEMKYKCTYCSAMYTAYPDIRQHYKSQHSNKPIPLPKQMRIMMLPSSSDAGHTAADNDNFINCRKSYKKMLSNNSFESERLQQSEGIKPVQETIIADKTLHNRRQITYSAIMSSNKKYVCHLCPPDERTIKYSSSRDIMYHMKAAHSKLLNMQKNNKKSAKTAKNKTAAVKLQKTNKAAKNNAVAVKQQTITKAEAAETAKNKTAAVKLQKTKKAAENNAAAVKQQTIMKAEAAKTAKNNAAAVKLVMHDGTEQNDNKKAEKENEIAEKVSEKEENTSKNKETHSKKVQKHNKKANEGLLSARYVHKGLYTKLNNIFICQLCIPMAGKKQYSSTYRSSVCRHINYEHFSKHQCTDCGKVLSTRFSLERHKRQRKNGCNYSRTLNSQLQKFFNQNLALQYESKNLVSSVTDDVECERAVALQSEHNRLSLQEQKESFVSSEQQKFSDESSNAENVNEASLHKEQSLVPPKPIAVTMRCNNLETSELHNQENFNIDHEQEETKTQEGSLHKEQPLEQFKAFAVTMHDNIPKTDEIIKDKDPNNFISNHKQIAVDAKELPYKKINNVYICMLCLPLTGQQQQHKSKCKNKIIHHISKDHFTKLNYSKYATFFRLRHYRHKSDWSAKPLLYHMPYKKFNNMYICILCKQKQRKFSTPYQYTIIRHINKNHYVKYKCKCCGKVFTSKYCLQRHYQLKSACPQYKVNEDYNGVKNSKDIPLTTCQEKQMLGQHKTAAAASLLYDNGNTAVQTDHANSDVALPAANYIASKESNANNYFTKTNKVSDKQTENEATISFAVQQKPQRFRTNSHKKVGNLLVCMLCRPLAGETAFTTACYEAIRRHRNKVHYKNYKCTDCGKSFVSKFNLNRHKQYENACAKYIVHNECSNDTDKPVSANDSAAAVPLSEFDVFKQELKDGSTAAPEISVNNLNITDSMIFIKEEKQLNDDYEFTMKLDKNVAGLHNEECSIVNSGSIKDQLSKYHQYFRQNSCSSGEHDVQLKEAGKMSLTEHFKDPLTENIKNELTENIDDPLTEDIEIALTEDIEEFQFITSPTACELTSDIVANSVSRNFEEIDGKYMCSPCSDAGTTKIFNNKQSLLKHTKETHFNVSKNIKKNNASLHEEKASAIKNVNSKYVCTLCLTNGNKRQYTSFDLKAIKRHVLHRHFQTNQCQHCAKNFSNKSNLKRHLDQKIPCTVAKTSCTLEKDLIKDLEQEKIHQCTTCGEIFTKKFYLKRHRSMVCNK